MFDFAIYTMYIRSILDYADIIWDNCSFNQKVTIERLQNEAIRIITALPKRCPINDLLKESNMMRLGDRRRQHQLIHLFKTIHGMAPSYFTDLLPPPRDFNPRYALRNISTIVPVHARHEFYNKSFLPQNIRDWNALPPESTRNNSLSQFKKVISTQQQNVIYFETSRILGIIHTQLMYRCSHLNSHLFRHNFCDSPNCVCGATDENTDHYFFHCPRYDNVRAVMLWSINDFLEVNLRVDAFFLLFGNVHLTQRQNEKIFSITQRFISGSRRFNITNSLQ